jgi:hypothetical protein
MLQFIGERDDQSENLFRHPGGRAFEAFRGVPMTTKSNPHPGTDPAEVVHEDAVPEAPKVPLPPDPSGSRRAISPPPKVPEAPRVPLPPDLQGRWIAWDENQENLFAVADTYPELMERVQQMGLVDPIIERAPGLHPAIANMPFELLEGESSDILKDIRETIPDAEEWLETPNTRLWCKKPRDLIGTTQERQLRYLLRGFWSGITS